MAWHGIEGHDDIIEKLRLAVNRHRLASSFLFCGPEGIGKRMLAIGFAQALLCERNPESDLNPCGTCPSCAMVTAGTHPDMDIVRKPEEKSELPLDLLLGPKERRGQEGLCHNIGLKPFMGRRRIAIIDDADYLNAEGANCLLKTLEEPPPRSVLILIGTSPARQLPTIRSRCQLIRFRPLPLETVADLLMKRGIVSDPAEARRLAEFSEGSTQVAVELADPDLWAHRRMLQEKLSAPVLDSVSLAQEVSRFVDEAGKEATVRRARLRQVVNFAADFYRQAMHAQGDASISGDALCAASCLDRCVETLSQIDRNANQSTLIEAWLDDLSAQTSR